MNMIDNIPPVDDANSAMPVKMNANELKVLASDLESAIGHYVQCEIEQAKVQERLAKAKNVVDNLLVKLRYNTK
jgi:hypothetical protein